MSNSKKDRKQVRIGRRRRVRAKIFGTPERPRLSVFRSAKHMYAQVIDDESGKTLVSADDLKLSKSEVAKAEAGDRAAKRAVAYAIGKKLAAAAQKKGIETVVFDRNGFVYTGRVQALADGARDGGLKF